MLFCLAESSISKLRIVCLIQKSLTSWNVVNVRNNVVKLIEKGSLVPSHTEHSNSKLGVTYKISNFLSAQGILTNFIFCIALSSIKKSC